MGSAMKQSLKQDAARRVRGCLPCFITFVFVSDVDLALVRHFFEGEEGVLRQHFLMGRQMGKLEDGERKKQRLLAAKRAPISSLD